MSDNSNRSANADHGAKTFDVRRMMGLETASGMLGQPALADALVISQRSLRRKVTAERGVSNADLCCAASALEALAVRATLHAEKLRALID